MIFFIVSKKNQGSAILRGVQISDELNRLNIESKVVTESEIPPQQKNSLFVWIKQINLECVKRMAENIHVYDVVDNYIYRQKLVTHIINNKLVDHLIVNNKRMKTEMCKNYNFSVNDVSVIHHHWDPRVSTAVKVNQDNLTFGYLGSVASLKHTNNFLHYNEIVDRYDIKFYDTEIGKDVSNLVSSGLPVRDRTNPNAFSSLKINFNCHISIREENTPEAKYKTSAKVATASALNHNIVTTYEHATKDILPEEYPFILKKTDKESIFKMFNLIKMDYDTGKVLWNKGLSIMKDIKQSLNIQTVITDYVQLINKLQVKI